MSDQRDLRLIKYHCSDQFVILHMHFKSRLLYLRVLSEIVALLDPARSPIWVASLVDHCLRLAIPQHQALDRRDNFTDAESRT